METTMTKYYKKTMETTMEKSMKDNGKTMGTTIKKTMKTMGTTLETTMKRQQELQWNRL